VWSTAVAYDTHGIFKAALDNYLLAPPLPRTTVRRFDRDVVHIRLTSASVGDSGSGSGAGRCVDASASGVTDGGYVNGNGVGIGYRFGNGNGNDLDCGSANGNGSGHGSRSMMAGECVHGGACKNGRAHANGHRHGNVNVNGNVCGLGKANGDGDGNGNLICSATAHGKCECSNASIICSVSNVCRKGQANGNENGTITAVVKRSGSEYGYGYYGSSSANVIGVNVGGIRLASYTGIDDNLTGSGEVYVFSYGAVVSFGLTESVERSVRYALGNYESGRLELSDSVSESFRYQYFPRDEPQSPTLLRVVHDTLLIASTQEDELLLSVKLSIAYAMAQHLKLCLYESELDKVSARVAHIPSVLAATGSLDINKRDILKLQGELFELISTPRVEAVPPDFIWDREHLEHCFHATRDYLNLDQRLSLLNSRLDRLDGLFSLCRDVLNTSYGHHLEYIVIFLIILEVAISLIELAIFVYGAQRME
jgi:uncharacterized Rmd1/YagE family protein